MLNSIDEFLKTEVAMPVWMWLSFMVIVVGVSIVLTVQPTPKHDDAVMIRPSVIVTQADGSKIEVE